MTPHRFAKLRAVLERRQPDLTVLMENVHKSHNFSAVLRTCDAVGIGEAHAVAPKTTFRVYSGLAGGARRWVEVHKWASLEEAFAVLRGQGLQILAAHPAREAVDFRAIDYTRPTAVLLGQERDGVTAEAAGGADGWIVIPMMGTGLSLNVSVAAALILFEAQRQRAEAGLYDHPRLPAETRRRRLFEWAYPEIAELCRNNGTPYPELSEDGEILGDVPRG